ncbi:MAG TPA: hypothetical protein VLE72_02370 [Candidatus Saccharimonadales bacterium]|nr:hypothetical protein [Candidatus Saccharimonadales bacterium]
MKLTDATEAVEIIEGRGPEEIERVIDKHLGTAPPLYYCNDQISVLVVARTSQPDDGRTWHPAKTSRSDEKTQSARVASAIISEFRAQPEEFFFEAKAEEVAGSPALCFTRRNVAKDLRVVE